MLEEIGDLWDKYAAGHTIVITTNGTVRKDGACVMGRGCAGQAKERFPKFPYKVGAALQRFGNVPFWFEEFRIVTMPVKEHWGEWARTPLIAQSALALSTMPGLPVPVYLPRPGCGNGHLRWEMIQAIIAPILNNNFIVMHNG